MSDNDTLGDFDPSEDDSDENDEQVENDSVTIPDVEDDDAAEQVAEQLEATGEQGRRTVLQGVERESPIENNPLDLDPRVGLRDVCYDRAKPGAKVQVVEILAETVEDYYEEFPDAPALDEYAGNVVCSMRESDAVFACVYLKDVLTSVDTKLTAYPMPESRLTRYPIEQASMVGSSSLNFSRSKIPLSRDVPGENVEEVAEHLSEHPKSGSMVVKYGRGTVRTNVREEAGDPWDEKTDDELPEEVEQRLQEVFADMVEEVPERELPDTQPGVVAGSAASIVAIEFDMNEREIIRKMDVQDLLSTDDEDDEGEDDEGSA